MSARDLFFDHLKRLFLSIVTTLGVFALCGFLLDKVEVIVMRELAGTFGSNAVLVTAVVGTPLHEIAHWLGCKIFGFKVYDVVLLRHFDYKTDGILGYVSYSYSQNNWWQRLGCLFTGIAPMLLGTVFIYLIVRLLVPEVYTAIRTRLDTPRKEGQNAIVRLLSYWKDAFIGFWSGLFSLRKWGILRGIFALYIVMSISMHMTLSPQDIKNALTGLGILLIIYVVVTFIETMIGKDYKLKYAKIAVTFTMILSVGLVFDVLLYVIGFLLNLI